MVAQTSAGSSFFEVKQYNVEEVLELLLKIKGELQSILVKKYSPNCEKN